MKRVHTNSDGSKIALDLNEIENRFYLQAFEKVERNVDWLKFDAFAFGLLSPIYQNEKNHLDVLQKPFYKALKDMSMRLGIRQGYIRQSR